MPMNTTLWAAQDALLAALEGAAGLAGVKTGLGMPAKLEREHVWISGELDDWSYEHPVSGLHAKDEQYVLPVHIVVTRTGTTYQDCRARIVDLMTAVEGAIYADPTLDGSVMLARPVRGTVNEAIGSDARTRSLLVTMYVRCDAHVSD